ncbi:hypothetical protein [Maribacter sp. ACAM166]|uniref:hypothetical protein n=1 Tax=Maribacter sp. ACAM166 TaxID=2508996 RepID=UPI0010FF42D3|nr:hypothetical protein [Maribacter sp. ACAM166]TLP80480.1 hypothetical protein ES765_08445 [Maribacter sp. ACAM166]
MKPTESSKPYISELDLKTDLADFTTKMTKKDTIKIIANLTMEYWVRQDELELTKINDRIRLKTTIREDTTFELKFEMRTNDLPRITFQNKTFGFEKHFADQVERTKGGDKYQWIYKIINQKDTLTFHTTDLGDKGLELQNYFKFMLGLYPDEKEFKPLEVIEKTE